MAKTKLCPTCKGQGSIPVLPDNIGLLIARGCEREVHVTWGRVFCGICGGVRWKSTKDCPYCEVQRNNNWPADVFADAMAAHRKKEPEIYDDPHWYAQKRAGEGITSEYGKGKSRV